MSGPNDNGNNNQQLNQYDALSSGLNLSGIDTSTLQHHQQLQQQANSQNLLNSTAHLQLQMDPTSRLFI